jgi:hypothetical protein
MSDIITVIRTRRGKRLAKLIRADGAIEDYDSAFTFDLLPQPVGDLDAVHDLLARLLPRSDCAVVRGVPIDPARRWGVRRLAFPDKETGDQPTLREAPHRWLALDVDSVARPENVPADNLELCAAEAVQRLPATFHAARCIVQASASHGIKPGCRLRLWYWLDRAATDADLKRWLRGAPVDPSVFRTVQPIYTAAPVFAAGVVDHLPLRLAVRDGCPVVAVPSPAVLAPPPPRPLPPLPIPGWPGSGGYAFAALVNAAVRVQRAGIGQRHETLLCEARGLARFVAAGLLTAHDVASTLRGAGLGAGKAEDEIDSIIAWGMDHPSGAALPEGAIR